MRRSAWSDVILYLWWGADGEGESFSAVGRLGRCTFSGTSADCRADCEWPMTLAQEKAREKGTARHGERGTELREGVEARRGGQRRQAAQADERVPFGEGVSQMSSQLLCLEKRGGSRGREIQRFPLPIVEV